MTTSQIRSNRVVVIYMVPSLIEHKETLSYMSTMCQFRKISLYHGEGLLPWITTIKAKTFNINHPTATTMTSQLDQHCRFRVVVVSAVLLTPP